MSTTAAVVRTRAHIRCGKLDVILLPAHTGPIALSSIHIGTCEDDVLDCIKKQVYVPYYVSQCWQGASMDVIKLVTGFLNNDVIISKFYLEFSMINPVFILLYADDPRLNTPILEVKNPHLHRLGWPVRGLAVIFASDSHMELQASLQEEDEALSESKQESKEEIHSQKCQLQREKRAAKRRRAAREARGYDSDDEGMDPQDEDDYDVLYDCMTTDIGKLVTVFNQDRKQRYSR